MKILILNLKRAEYRRKHMVQEMEKYGIIDYKFIEATDAQDFTPKYITQIYNPSIKKSSRELNSGELACALSHKKIYKKILEDVSNEPYIILEDDIVLVPQFLRILKSKAPLPENIDLIRLGFGSDHREAYLNNPTHKHHKITQTYIQQPNIIKCMTTHLNDKWVATKINKNQKFEINSIPFYKVLPTERLYGTFGYIINKRSIETILNSPYVLDAADDIFFTSNLNSYVSNKLLVNMATNDRSPESESHPMGGTIDHSKLGLY
jgi:GR25 family glycosyltransferase involved in LPS biosynthesis